MQYALAETKWNWQLPSTLPRKSGKKRPIGKRPYIVISCCWSSNGFWWPLKRQRVKLGILNGKCELFQSAPSGMWGAPIFPQRATCNATRKEVGTDVRHFRNARVMKMATTCKSFRRLTHRGEKLLKDHEAAIPNAPSITCITWSKLGPIFSLRSFCRIWIRLQYNFCYGSGH